MTRLEDLIEAIKREFWRPDWQTAAESNTVLTLAGAAMKVVQLQAPDLDNGLAVFREILERRLPLGEYPTARIEFVNERGLPALWELLETTTMRYITEADAATRAEDERRSQMS